MEQHVSGSEGARKNSEDMDHKGYTYGNILRSRLSSTSSEGVVGSPPTKMDNFSPHYQQYQDMEAMKMANPQVPIPLHWKSIPMGWK